VIEDRPCESSAEQPLAAAGRWLQDQQPAMVRQLIQWVEISSGSHDLDGLQRMAFALRSAFADLPAQFQEIALPSWEAVDRHGAVAHHHTGTALLWECRATAPERVLLGIHYDTVHDHSQAGPPIAHWLSPDRLAGPGAADAKGGIVALLWALRACEQFQLAPSLGWTVLLNPDEELGSPASHGLWTDQAPRHRCGLLFEPTLPDDSLVAARKGSGNFAIIIRGHSAHVGRHPERGRNAITMAARLITQLECLQDPSHGTIVNVSRIDGGSPPNVVPDLAVIRVNIRIETPAQADACMSRLEELVSEVSTRDGFRAELHGRITAPPKVNDPPAQALQSLVTDAAGAIGRPIQWRNTGGVCDGNRLAAAGLPNVDTLGPRGDGLHSPHEWVDCSSLPRAAHLAASVLHQLHCRTGRGH